MRRVTINDPTTNRTAPQQPRQRCPEGLESYKAVPPPKYPNRHVEPIGPLDQILADSHILDTPEGRALGESPLDFLADHLPECSSATQIFTSRTLRPNTKVASDFHKACDNVPNVLVIIKSGQYIAGGFTAVAFESPNNYFYKANTDGTTFVFSLNRRKAYRLRNQKSAIICDKESGPVFGDCDIFIKNDFAKVDNHEQLYSSTSSFDNTNVVKGELFGTQIFAADEYEVYKLE